MNKRPRRKFDTWTFHDGRKKTHVECPHTRRIFLTGDQRGHFVEIYLWPRLKDVRALMQRNRRTTLAFFQETEEIHKRHGFRSKKIGEIHLAMRRVTYNTIAHEAYHATRCWAFRKGLKEPITRNERDADWLKGWHGVEEHCARVQGFLTDAIVAWVCDIVNARK